MLNNLTKQPAKVAYNAFVRDFSRSDLESLLQFELDRKLEDYSAKTDNLRDTVRHLHEAARREGFYNELLNKAKEQRKKNRAFVRDIDFVLNSTPKFDRVETKTRLRLNALLIVALIAVVILWGLLTIGFQTFFGILAVAGAWVVSLIAQMVFKLKLFQEFDLWFEHSLRSASGTIAIITLFALFLLFTLFFGMVYADANLEQRVLVHTPAKVELSPGEFLPLFLWPPFGERIDAQVAARREHTFSVRPWRRCVLRIEQFAPVGYVVVYPKGFLSDISFADPWQVTISVDQPTGEVTKHRVREYAGEPILLGRYPPFLRSVKVQGSVSQESLNRLKHDRVRSEHPVALEIGDRTVHATSPNPPLDVQSGQKITITMSYTIPNTDPPESTSYESTVSVPTFDQPGIAIVHSVDKNR